MTTTKISGISLVKRMLVGFLIGEAALLFINLLITLRINTQPVEDLTTPLSRLFNAFKDLLPFFDFTVVVIFPIICFSLFLIWLNTVRSNLFQQGIPNLAYSPAMSVGCFFIPVINLFKPWSVLQETVRASRKLIVNSDAPDWRALPASSLVNWWWFISLASVVIALYMYLFRQADIISSLFKAVELGWIPEAVVWLVSFSFPILTFFLVREIDYLQTTKRREYINERLPYLNEHRGNLLDRKRSLKAIRTTLLAIGFTGSLVANWIMLTGVSRSTGIELENNLVLFSTVYIISEICWLVGIYIWVLLKNRSRWFLLLCFTTWPAIVVMAALTDKSFIQPGGYAYTFNKRSGTITAFVDFNSQKAFSKALDINDYFGLTECRSTGKAFDLSPHTHVLVLDAHHDMRQLRVLSGPNTGRAGWVNKNCLSSTVK